MMDLHGALGLGVRVSGALGQLLGALTARDATVRTVLGRSVAAIERLGFSEWLDEH